MQIDKQEKTGRYALGWLVLDYLKAFTWPALALFVVMFGWNDLMTLLRDREVNLFGVTLGQRVEGVQQRAEGELQDIAFLVGELENRLAAVENGDESSAPPADTAPGSPVDAAPPTPEDARELTRQIETKIGSLRENLAREVEQVQMTAPVAQQNLPPAATTTPNNREQRVAALERTGFDSLLANDFDTALDAFTRARKIWPDYHNVGEIQRILAQRRDDPPVSRADWLRLYEMILIKYSWGMPDDVRAAMRAELKGK